MTFKHTCDEPDGDVFGFYHCNCGVKFYALNRVAPLNAEIKTLKERLQEAEMVIESYSDYDAGDNAKAYLEKWK